MSGAFQPCIQTPADGAVPTPVCGRYEAKTGNSGDSIFNSMFKFLEVGLRH